VYSQTAEKMKSVTLILKKINFVIPTAWEESEFSPLSDFSLTLEMTNREY